MTTIIGIKANRGSKKNRGVVFGSDLKATRTKWNPQGDVAYKEQTTSMNPKIYGAKSKDFAIGVAGIYDKPYGNFFADVLKGKLDIEKRLNEGFFPEFKELNLSRWDGTYPSTTDFNDFLIASRFNNKPELYHCFPMGKIIKISAYDAIGSGATYATDELIRLNAPIPNITLKRGIDLFTEALGEADRDIYTGGLDLAIVRPDIIQYFGKQINKKIEKAKKDAIRDVKAKLFD